MEQMESEQNPSTSDISVPNINSGDNNKNSNDNQTVNNNKYTECFLFNQDHGQCGPYARDRTERDEMTYIRDVDDDTTNHFKNLRFKDSLSTIRWTERER